MGSWLGSLWQNSLLKDAFFMHDNIHQCLLIGILKVECSTNLPYKEHRNLKCLISKDTIFVGYQAGRLFLCTNNIRGSFFYVRKTTDLLKPAKVNTYIVYMFEKIFIYTCNQKLFKMLMTKYANHISMCLDPQLN